MKRQFLRYVGSLLLAGLFAVSPASAQRRERGVSAEEEGPGLQTQPTAALPYAVAGITLILVMVVVCAPSRKAYKE
jgi:hypothetical protein